MPGTLAPFRGQTFLGLVAVGREFAFRMDYSVGKHWELVSSPSTVMTYFKDLAMHFTA